jgi:hypothetical protein
MKLPILVTFAAALAVLPGLSGVLAQLPGPDVLKEASQLPESGPAVVGGTGATVGPNSKNQAVNPMPGLEELSERPPDAAVLPSPEVRPIPGKPLKNNPATPGR